jgi:WhiB family redox-sensing transcriptional regulator
VKVVDVSGTPAPHRRTGGHAAGVIEGRDLRPHEDMPWAADANCLGVDPDLFFPERGSNQNHAKAVCAGCAVRSECLRYAIDHDEKYGTWGGLSARERGRLKRRVTLA